MWPEDESQGLYVAPAVPNAVEWSEDNLLAVVTGPAAVIFNPCQLSGPRTFTALRTWDLNLIRQAVGGIPHNADANLHHQMLLIRQSMEAKATSDAAVKGMAWSPLGCSADGGCVLATVTDDHRVRLFARADVVSREWACFTDLAEDLASYVQATDWVDASHEAGGKEGLRLRGGAPPGDDEAAAGSKRDAFTVGLKVEVCNDEPGLQGCWFTAKVLELRQNYALVAYDELQDEENEQEQLREWFPMDPERSLNASDVPKGFACHKRKGFVLRPRPDQQGGAENPQAGGANKPQAGGADDLQAGGADNLEAGDRVTYLQEGGWWEAEVLSVRPKEGKVTLRYLHANKKKVVSREKVRRSVVWEGGSVFTPVERSPVERLPNEAEMEDATPTPDPEADPADGKAVNAEKTRMNGKAAKDAPGHGAAKGKAKASSAPRKRSSGSRSTQKSGSRSTQKSAGTGRKNQGEGKAGGMSGGKRPSSSAPKSAKPPAKKQRRPPSPEEEPSPPPESTPEVESEEETFNPDKTEESQPEDKAESSSLETEDDEAFEPGNAAETLASLTGRERPSRQPTSEPATGGGRKKRSSIKGAKYFAEEYEVPEDFDPSLLQPVNFTGKRSTFVRTLCEAIIDRWLVLRCQVPEEEVPQYTKGGHMRGPDICNYEQMAAEFMHVHGEQMKHFKFTRKELNLEAKRAIRVTIINPAVRFHSADSGSDTEAPGEDGAPARKLTETEKVLRRLRRKRLEASQPRSPAVRENQAVGTTETPKRRRLIPTSRKKRNQMEGEDTAAKIPGADYERRLLLLSATCIAWSPIVATANDSAATAGASAGTGSFALLAVGTKAGRVWLWRYRPPQLAVAADLFAECKCLQMIGSVQVCKGHVRAIQWVVQPASSTLVQCSGSSDGAVHLTAFAVDSLVNAASPPPAPSTAALSHISATLAQPDLSGISCVSAAVAGKGGMCVAVGKLDGGVQTWTMATADFADAAVARAAARDASHASLSRAHASFPLTSVRWVRPPRPDGAASGLLASSGLDGHVKLWHCRLNKVELLSLVSSPEAESLNSAPVMQLRSACFGIALSGSSLGCAQAWETLSSKLDQLQETMTFKKMVKGRLDLVPLPLQGPDRQPEAAIAAALQACLRSEHGLVPAQLWDIAATMYRCFGAVLDEASEDDKDCDANGDADADGEGVGPTDPPVCSAEFTRELLGGLEAASQEALTAQSAKRKPQVAKTRGGLFGALDATAWRGLQAANVLRRLLHPSALAQRNVLGFAKGGPREASEVGRQWDAAIRRNELLLLQRHVLAKLSSGLPDVTAAEQRTSRLLMADWVTLHARHPMIQPELAAAAAAAYRACGEPGPEAAGDAAETQPPSRESVRGLDVGLTPDVHPLTCALSAQLDPQGPKVKLPRCAATLLLSLPGRSFFCRLCKRSYNQVPSSSLAACIFCGTRLSAPHPETTVAGPGWPH